MRIKFISPCAYFNVRKSLLPIGMARLAGFLKTKGHEVEQDDLLIKVRRRLESDPSAPEKINIMQFYDFKKVRDYLFRDDPEPEIEQTLDEILSMTSVEGYDLLCFSVVSAHQNPFALMLAKKIKKTLNIPIVFGGPFITLRMHLYLKWFPFIDYLIIGHGEQPLLKLLEHLEGKEKIENVPNLLYLKQGDVIRNRFQTQPMECTCLPDFEGLPIDLYWEKVSGDMQLVMPYDISKGCIFSCSFCKHNLMESFEQKSIKKAVDEIEALSKKYGAKCFHFTDSGINFDLKYLDSLMDAFISRQLGIRWGVFAVPNNLNKEMLLKMRKAGCEYLAYGIETGSEKVLKAMEKPFTLKAARRILKDTKEAGIKNIAHILVGHPHETEEDFRQTLDFLRENEELIFGIFPIKFFLENESPIHLNPEKHKIEVFLRESFLPLISNMHGGTHAFEEVGGMTWGERELVVKERWERLLRFIYEVDRKRSPEFKNISYDAIRKLTRKYFSDKEKGKFLYHKLEWSLERIKRLAIVDRFT